MKWIVGIDEVGRGALAGPVVVAVAAMPADFTVRNASLGALKDSKKLSASAREAWLSYFHTQPSITFALARVYPRQIEKRNISRAANIAAERAFGRMVKARQLGPAPAVVLDGGLFLGNGKQQRNVRTIIKADEKIAAVKIASIAAKVYRDGLMRRLAKHYPKYGFEIHKGYGTYAHRRALKNHGPSSVHRLTFIKKYATMGK
jgi:ribonuclease HII